MPYGNLNVDVVQSSTANTPVQFNDGNGTQVGTLCRAWVNWNGSNGSIRASFNVSSVTRGGTGQYTVNFTNAFSDANYVFTTATNNYSGNYLSGAALPTSGTPLTTSCPIWTEYALNGGTYYDPGYVYASFFR